MTTGIGILDPEGINDNPLTGRPYSSQYRELSRIWTKLPAYKNHIAIIQAIRDNQILLVRAGTGSGKTALIPKYALHVTDYKGKVAVTVPRQIVAESNAVFNAKQLDVEVGAEVGYKFRGSPEEAMSDKTRLLYVTDGTLVAQAIKDPKVAEFDIIIMDEAHERSVQMDFLLYLMRKTVELRSDFRFIIMSATIDVTIYEKYFEDYRFKTIDIEGQSNFPITSFFLDRPVGLRYLEKGFEIIRQIVRTDNAREEGAHDILFFVPTIAETKKVCQRVINELNGFCRELFAGLDEETVKLVTDRDSYKIKYGKDRKIVVSTNVAESSITIDGLKYVIDSGLELFAYYDPDIDAKVLEKRLISHASAKQRIGRAGRTEPGVAYHLYTRDDYEQNMDRFPVSTIRISNLYGEILRFLAMDSVKDIDDVIDIFTQFIEPPTRRYIDGAIRMLGDLSLLRAGVITDLGRVVESLQTEPMIGMSLWAAYHLDCLSEMTAIFTLIDAAKGSLSGLFLPKPIEDSKLYAMAMDKMRHKYGDHVTLLRIFIGYRQKKGTDDFETWMNESFLKPDVMEKADKHFSKNRRRNRKTLKQYKRLRQNNSENIALRIMVALRYGYRLHTAFNIEEGRYRTETTDNVSLNRMTFLTSDHSRLLYHDLVNFNKKLSINILSIYPEECEDLFKELQDLIVNDNTTTES